MTKSQELPSTNEANCGTEPGKGSTTGSDQAAAPQPQASVTTANTKALIRTIVGTGIGLATLLLMLIALMFQQNANVNARIDDVQANIRDLRADVQADVQDIRADIRELREIVINVLKGAQPAD